MLRGIVKTEEALNGCFECFFMFPADHGIMDVAICKLCSKIVPYEKRILLSRHIKECHSEWVGAMWLSIFPISLTQKKLASNSKISVSKSKSCKFTKIKKHPLKPWQDPESLFCSPKLSEITKKEIKPCNQKGD